MDVIVITVVQGFALEVSEALSTGGTQGHKRFQTTLANHLELYKFLSVVLCLLGASHFFFWAAHRIDFIKCSL